MCHGVDKHGGVLTFHIEGTHIFIMTGLHRFKMDGYIKSFYKHSQMKKRTISNDEDDSHCTVDIKEGRVMVFNATFNIFQYCSGGQCYWWSSRC